VPTFGEIGIGDALTNTFSLWGPAGLPPALVEVLAGAVRTAMQDPVFVELAATRLAYTLRFRPGSVLPAELDALDGEWAPRLRGAPRPG